MWRLVVRLKIAKDKTSTRNGVKRPMICYEFMCPYSPKYASFVSSSLRSVVVLMLLQEALSVGDLPIDFQFVNSNKYI